MDSVSIKSQRSDVERQPMFVCLEGIILQGSLGCESGILGEKRGEKIPSGYGLESLKKNPWLPFQGGPGAFEGVGNEELPHHPRILVSEQFSGWVVFFWFANNQAISHSVSSFDKYSFQCASLEKML